MKRLVLTTLAGLTAFALVTGLAASLTVNSDQLGAGTAVVAACDPDGVDVSFGLAAGDISNVSQVTLSNVAAACNGQTIHLQLLDGTGTALATETAPVGGTGTDTVALSSVVDAASITDVTVTITG